MREGGRMIEEEEGVSEGGGGGRFTSSSWPSQDIYSAMCNVLAAIHSVDIEKSNLTDFGKHGELQYHIL